VRCARRARAKRCGRVARRGGSDGSEIGGG
jgi:hypothetical protein